jgi:CBS domain-containing protein
MKLTCPGCGYQNLEGADHCQECMSPLTHDDIPKPTMGLQEQLLGKTLRDLNPLTPVMLPQDTPIREAVGKMLKRNVSCVLVVEQGQLLGIVTERDILMHVAGKDLNPDVEAVSSIMVKNPVVLKEEDSIAFALNKMSVGRYRHLPFLTNKVPTGFISIKTILRFLCRNL